MPRARIRAALADGTLTTHRTARRGPPKALPAAEVARMAKRAIARRVPTGDPVTLPLRLMMTRARWEALSAKAIREGRNLRERGRARARGGQVMAEGLGIAG